MRMVSAPNMTVGIPISVNRKTHMMMPNAEIATLRICVRVNIALDSSSRLRSTGTTAHVMRYTNARLKTENVISCCICPISDPINAKEDWAISPLYGVPYFG